jgi:hypothetical protein
MNNSHLLQHNYNMILNYLIYIYFLYILFKNTNWMMWWVCVGCVGFGGQKYSFKNIFDFKNHFHFGL